MIHDPIVRAARNGLNWQDFVRVSAMGDENGRIPPPDPNPPLGGVPAAEIPPGTPLRKVVNSRPWPPKEDEEDPTEAAPADR